VPPFERSDLADLTMIMMTGTRPRTFHDIVEQYALGAPDLQILVGDFGDEDVQRQNAATAAEFPHTVRHHPFPPQTPWHERFRTLLDICETPYVVMAADDDFLIPEGLRESVAFLRGRPDYAGAHGIYYVVAPTAEPGQLGVAVFCGFTGRAYESDTAAGRLVALLYYYQSVYYAVQRRDDLRRLAVPPEVQTGAMIELFTASATVIAGKIARLRSPYCLRNEEVGDSSVRVNELTDVILMGGEAFMAEYLPVRRALTALLQAADGTGRDWARVIDVAFASHVRKHWREVSVWSRLAQRGDIPAEDVAVLAAPGIESESLPIPIDALAPYIGPLAARGWPKLA
jgi:glycosyltransferase domain-containing protein